MLMVLKRKFAPPQVLHFRLIRVVWRAVWRSFVDLIKAGLDQYVLGTSMYRVCA